MAPKAARWLPILGLQVEVDCVLPTFAIPFLINHHMPSARSHLAQHLHLVDWWSVAVCSLMIANAPPQEERMAKVVLSQGRPLHLLLPIVREKWCSPILREDRSSSLQLPDNCLLLEVSHHVLHARRAAATLQPPCGHNVTHGRLWRWCLLRTQFLPHAEQASTGEIRCKSMQVSQRHDVKHAEIQVSDHPAIKHRLAAQ
mmetsp:Transcript_137641/g.343522  ORF Transcript_137641/g.343522 Transcript_137641/m.343522 type:complete len:200 (-) Transcript_137641:699-1298(-)